MRRGVVIAFALVALLVAAPNAFAYRGGPSTPITSSGNTTAVKTALRAATNPTPSGPLATTANVGKGMTRMRVAAGLSPALRLAGTLGLYVTAFQVGWQIGSVPGDYIYNRLTGGIGTTTITAGTLSPWYARVQPLKWEWRAAGTDVRTGSVASTSSLYYTAVAGWFLQWKECVTTTTCTPTDISWIHSGPASEVGNAIATAMTIGAHSGTGSTGPTAYAWRVSEAAMEAAVARAPITSTEYTAETNKLTASTFTRPATTSDAEMNAALDEVGARDSTNRSSSDPDAEAVVDSINHQLDPSYSADNFTMPNCLGLSVSACNALLDTAGQTGTRTATVLDLAGADVTKPAGAIITTSPGATTSVTVTTPVTYTRNPDVMPVLLPQPLLNETADEFIARLHALGYTGAISVVELTETTGVVELGASAPVRIRATTTTGVRTLDPLAWPATAPRIHPTSDLEISENPSTYPPATLEELPPPGTSTGPTCACPPIDFSPLTGLGLGDVFPFAVFGYVTDVLDLFDVEPEAPRFDLRLHTAQGTPEHRIYLTTPHCPDGGLCSGKQPGQYDGTLEAFDPYMSIVRLLMTFALWIGALWFVGAKLLGFKAAGDMSEAADDGSVY